MIVSLIQPLHHTVSEISTATEYLGVNYSPNKTLEEIINELIIEPKKEDENLDELFTNIAYQTVIPYQKKITNKRIKLQETNQEENLKKNDKIVSALFTPVSKINPDTIAPPKSVLYKLSSDPNQLVKFNDKKFYTVSDRPLNIQPKIFNESLQTVSKGHGNDHSKPIGLYLAPGRSWLDFAEKTGRKRFKRRYLYNYELSSELDKRILKLPSTNQQALIQFSQKYKGTSLRPETSNIIERILWTDVAKDYWGVSFIPYTEDFNNIPELKWYSTLEAPQLIIWNAPPGAVTVTLVADATKDFIYKEKFKGGRKRKTRKRKKK